jgi:hypothetical protein
MPLRYRGVSYEANPEIVETVATRITAKFRGLPYLVRRPVKRLTAKSLVTLKFRGAAYTQEQASTIQPQLPTTGSGSNQHPAPSIQPYPNFGKGC